MFVRDIQFLSLFGQGFAGYLQQIDDTSRLPTPHLQGFQMLAYLAEILVLEILSQYGIISCELDEFGQSASRIGTVL